MRIAGLEVINIYFYPAEYRKYQENPDTCTHRLCIRSLLQSRLVLRLFGRGVEPANTTRDDCAFWGKI